MAERKPEGHPCWGYRGSEGPDDWGRLHPDWRVCAEGLEQSPIVLPKGDAAPIAERFALHYQATTGRLSDNTHALQVDMEPGSQLVLGDQAFSLKQFHFHTPSEHLWSDTADAGELHLVHVNDSGGIAVLGIALRSKAMQAFPDSLWEWFSKVRAGEALMLDPARLVPQASDFLSYRGSLTTPPCTEGVRWLLATEPMAMEPEQRQWLEHRTGQNARPVQSLGDRAIHAILREDL